MALYQRGSLGPEVAKIQERLQQLGFYAGPLDGVFGGGTESSIKTFQQGNRLPIDGRVGPVTWEALLGGIPIEEPAILSAPLERRCLALTGSFETGQPPPECFAGLSGDFDGQGISLGVCQWNLGQRSLPPLLLEIDQTHREVVDAVFQDHAAELRAVLGEPHEEQMNWARSMQDARNNIAEPWRGLLKSLCRRTEFQTIQTKYANNLLAAARTLCSEFGVRSQRALALLFDIKVQNGSIKDVVKVQIARDFAALTPSGNSETDEIARLRICQGMQRSRRRVLSSRRSGRLASRWDRPFRTEPVRCTADPGRDVPDFALKNGSELDKGVKGP